jgi:hypothetical protein
VAANPPRLASILNQPAKLVRAELGIPAVDDDDDPSTFSYRLGPVAFLVTYRKGRARDFILEGDGHSAADLAEWLGVDGDTLETNGARFHVRTTGETLSFLDTSLPMKRVDIRKAMGLRSPQLRRLLGKPETEAEGMDVFKPWYPDDRIGIVVNYDDDGVASWIDIGFNDGVSPANGRQELSSYAEQLAWLGLPLNGGFQARGTDYQVIVSGGNISVKAE